MTVSLEARLKKMREKCFLSQKNITMFVLGTHSSFPIAMKSVAVAELYTCLQREISLQKFD
jgi:hypothetical protein